MSQYHFTHRIPRGGRDASTSPQQVAGASAVAGPGQPGRPRAADAAAGDGTAATGSREVQGGPAAPWRRGGEAGFCGKRCDFFSGDLGFSLGIFMTCV